MATAEVSGVREVASRRRCTGEDYCVAPDSLHPRVGKITYEDGVFRHDVDLRELPDFSALKVEVERRVAAMSWWQSYGADTCAHLGGVLGAVASLWLLSSHNLVVFATGVLLLGCCHAILAIKGGHLTAHRAACQSVFWNRLLGFFFSDLCGTFPSDAAYEIHVKGHHPHTNIIGLGDSSTFKAPLLPAFVYMFIAPLFLPVITPVVAVTALLGRWLQLARFVAIASLGLCASLCLLTTVSGCTFLGSLAVMVVSRAVLAIPYIHINIFQHIGLPMFSARHRPKRLYQMSVGVLNLSSNPLLELCFGHGIISCHVEHHLFPRLSDQQCLRVKPLVQRFLKANGLPYHEASYTDRLGVFLARYSQLMVNAPPISHFVGIQ